MDFNYWDLGQQSEGAVVRVSLEGNAANVKLMDYSNYRWYQSGQRHNYYGGALHVLPGGAAGTEQRSLVRNHRLRRTVRSWTGRCRGSQRVKGM